MTGRTYLERGNPVTVLIGFGHGAGIPALTARFFVAPPKRLGPRNVLIQRADGSRTVRGFRGLRLPKETPNA